MLNVAQTIVEVSIAIVYIAVMFAIVTSKSKTFKNAFFLIFVATGSTDVTSLLANSFIRANRQADLGIEFKYIVLFCIVIGGMSYIAHMIGNVLIAINRFSALCIMHRYDKIWSRKNVWITIGVQYSVAFLACIHIATADLIYIENADGTYTYKSIEKQADQIARIMYFGFSVMYAVISVIVNARSIFEWYKLSWKRDGPRRGVQEKGLLIYTAIVFFSTMLMCSQQVTIVFASFTSNDNLYFWAAVQYFWLNDFMVSIPPFSIMLLSSELRKIVLKLFRSRKVQPTMTSFVPNLMSRSLPQRPA